MPRGCRVGFKAKKKVGGDITCKGGGIGLFGALNLPISPRVVSSELPMEDLVS